MNLQLLVGAGCYVAGNFCPVNPYAIEILLDVQAEDRHTVTILLQDVLSRLHSVIAPQRVLFMVLLEQIARLVVLVKNTSREPGSPAFATQRSIEVFALLHNPQDSD